MRDCIDQTKVGVLKKNKAQSILLWVKLVLGVLVF